MIAYYCLLAGIFLGWLIGYAHGLDAHEPSAKQFRNWRDERLVLPNRRRS